MPMPQSPLRWVMADGPGAPLDEIAELLAGESDADLTATPERLEVVGTQMFSVLTARRVPGVGVDAGVRYPAIDVTTTLRGNLTAPSSPRLRAYRLNPHTAVGAMQAHPSAARAGMVLGSRICIDSEVPWEATGRHLVRMAVLEAGANVVPRPSLSDRQRDRAGLGVWRNNIQGIAAVERDQWRVTRRAADRLMAQPLGWPTVRGATVRLRVQADTAEGGAGLTYTLQLPTSMADPDALAVLCDALNEQEWRHATGAPHIGAWSATSDGDCCYRVRVPARLGRRMPDLPRQLLATSGARVNAAAGVQQAT